jgi:hypothetical protein
LLVTALLGRQPPKSQKQSGQHRGTIDAILSEQLDPMTNYTITERDRCAAAGDVTKNGVVFDYELVSINGAHFTLIREPYHTDDDIRIAKEHLRRDHDVVKLSVARLESSNEDPTVMTFVHVDCSLCGTLYRFPATRDQFQRYFASGRELIQDIFPELPIHARAVLTQGNVCALCLAQLEDVRPFLAPYMR